MGLGVLLCSGIASLSVEKALGSNPASSVLPVALPWANSQEDLIRLAEKCGTSQAEAGASKTKAARTQAGKSKQRRATTLACECSRHTDGEVAASKSSQSPDMFNFGQGEVWFSSFFSPHIFLAVSMKTLRGLEP